MPLLELAHELYAETRRKACNPDDPTLTAQLERGEKQRRRSGEHGPLRHRFTVCRQVLRIARRILDSDDALVSRELLQKRRLEREMSVLGDVIDEDGHGARVGDGTEMERERRERCACREVR